MPYTFTVDYLNAVVVNNILSGSLSGSFSGTAYGITASLVNFTGILNGFASGSFVSPTTQLVYQNRPVLKRSLLQFDVSAISKSMANGSITSPKFVLNLKTTEADEVPLNYSIFCFPISGSSWSMGTGVFAFGGTLDGVNWLYSNYPNTNSVWYPGINTNTVVTDDYLNVPSTASFVRGGGTWYYTASGINLACSQSFSYQNSDVSLDISPICYAWISGSIPNYGIILMSSGETNPNTQGGEIKFFSKETNTIYSPYIDVQWDDSSFVTASLAPITSSLGVNITIKNLKKEYKHGSKPRFNVFAREKYPQKVFSQIQTPYLIPKYLPSSSYYAIKDNESEEMIINFDNYTLLSCDQNGNYFFLDTTGLPQERYYRILVQSTFDNGDIEIFDTGNIFKIVR